MRIEISVLGIAAAAVVGGCSTSVGPMSGVRSDGLPVECESGPDSDVQVCTPEDGDDECESWEDGGSAFVLWPPNHKLVRFTLDVCDVARDCDDEDDDGGDDGDDDGDDDSGDVGDDGGDDYGDDGGVDAGPVEIVRRAVPGPDDVVPVAITSITADEAVEVGAGGDGHTTDFDVAIIDDVTFELRSERQGGGDGRVYRVHYIDSDDEAGFCEFMVPHDHRKPFGGAVDSGTVVTVLP
jgi:hypothetical protein